MFKRRVDDLINAVYNIKKIKRRYLKMKVKIYSVIKEKDGNFCVEIVKEHGTLVNE